MVGYKNERYLQFGWASARFDDLANWLPARLTGRSWCWQRRLPAFRNGSMAGNAARWRQPLLPQQRHPRGGGRRCAGGKAGRDVTLYFGKPVEKPTIGDPLKPLSREAYRGVVRLMYGAEGLMVVVW